MDPKNNADESQFTTPKQRAFLEYLGLPVPRHRAEAEAARKRARQEDETRGNAYFWKWDRFHLYPELYRTEIREKKANRVDELYKATKKPYLVSGPRPLPRLTKEEVTEVVEFLDRDRPGWDFYFWEPGGVSLSTYEVMFIPAAVYKFPHRLAKRAHPLFSEKEIPLKPPVRGKSFLDPRLQKVRLRILRKKRAAFWLTALGVTVVVVLLTLAGPEMFGMSAAGRPGPASLPGVAVIPETTGAAKPVAESAPVPVPERAPAAAPAPKSEVSVVVEPAAAVVGASPAGVPEPLVPMGEPAAVPSVGPGPGRESAAPAGPAVPAVAAVVPVPAPVPAAAPSPAPSPELMPSPVPAPVPAAGPGGAGGGAGTPSGPEPPPLEGFYNLVSLDGRTIRAKVILVTQESVLVEREDFVKFDIRMDTLSAESADLVRRVFRGTRAKVAPAEK